ncbi:granzyme B-like [Chanos chanos]|uniref:Granzyme B-like n=1 Tax=Chanos chanos TaxID=29144 RepID=A0A6J2WA11_CHACN|nr:granzyme B-like [Chanos chanos]
MANTPLLLLISVLPVLTLSAYVDVGIVNGTEAKPHSKPYMVSVQKDGQHFCGGFLVSESFVMTAAHCFQWAVKLTVVVGIHDLSKKRPSDQKLVKFYHIHPGYNQKPLENDIMLLQLNEKVQKGKTVQWLSLPKKKGEVKAKTSCSVAGWGANRTKGYATQRLLEANVSIMDKKDCSRKWNSYFKPSSMICAGGVAGFCQGDSGGPLVCKEKAVGVVSFNEKDNCDRPNRPNVYTQISKFLPWINGIIGSLK